ncbi:TEL2 family protein [Megasphaera sp. ASD88]|nr:TEL2 family protein [Megasphaera sp. ASD88]
MEQFIRDIIEYFRDPENVEAFEEWLKHQQEDGDKP